MMMRMTDWDQTGLGSISGFLLVLNKMILNILMSTDRQSESVIQIPLGFENVDVVPILDPFNASAALHLYR